MSQQKTVIRTLSVPWYLKAASSPSSILRMYPDTDPNSTIPEPGHYYRVIYLTHQMVGPNAHPSRNLPPSVKAAIMNALRSLPSYQWLESGTLAAPGAAANTNGFQDETAVLVQVAEILVEANEDIGYMESIPYISTAAGPMVNAAKQADKFDLARSKAERAVAEFVAASQTMSDALAAMKDSYKESIWARRSDGLPLTHRLVDGDVATIHYRNHPYNLSVADGVVFSPRWYGIPSAPNSIVYSALETCQTLLGTLQAVDAEIQKHCSYQPVTVWAAFQKPIEPLGHCTKALITVGPPDAQAGIPAPISSESPQTTPAATPRPAVPAPQDVAPAPAVVPLKPPPTRNRSVSPVGWKVPGPKVPVAREVSSSPEVEPAPAGEYPAWAMKPSGSIAAAQASAAVVRRSAGSVSPAPAPGPKIPVARNMPIPEVEPAPFGEYPGWVMKPTSAELAALPKVPFSNISWGGAPRALAADFEDVPHAPGESAASTAAVVPQKPPVRTAWMPGKATAPAPAAAPVKAPAKGWSATPTTVSPVAMADALSPPAHSAAPASATKRGTGTSPIKGETISPARSLNSVMPQASGLTMTPAALQATGGFHSQTSPNPAAQSKTVVAAPVAPAAAVGTAEANEEPAPAAALAAAAGNEQGSRRFAMLGPSSSRFFSM